MRVLMISKAMVAKAYHSKLEELGALGIDMNLALPKAWGDQKLELSHRSKVKVYPLNTFFNGKNHFYFYLGLSKVMSIIKPEIVHIDEEPYSLVTFQAMRLAKKIGAKTLFFTWQNIFKNYPLPFSLIEKYNFKKADSAIAGNKEAKNIIKLKGFDKKIEIIPQFGVDPNLFRRFDFSILKFLRKEKKLEDKFTIGFVGRFIKEKGIFTLIEAASKIKNDFTLLFIGNGPLEKLIYKKAQIYGIEKNIKTINWVPSIEVPQYLNCIDCLVLPSLTTRKWKEQFGRILIEAMSCEIPVIGSDSGEIPNVIGDAGLIFREGDADDLFQKIELLQNDSGLRYILGKKGRERVLNNFTQKKIAEETFQLYIYLKNKLR